MNLTYDCEYNCSDLWPTRANTTLPPELQFNSNSLIVVIVYCSLFTMAAVGNLTVFITLFRSRHRKSRINLMITHLAVADLLVTFIMIPLEIGWRLTVQWIAGNAACKVFLFLRAFGLYLSSNVLVCVSLDRYYAVLHPLKVNDARRRGKTMLACAWGISFLYSAPQSVIFHVQKHPQYPAFRQCVTFGFFTSMTQEAAYNLFCVIAMYFIPLLVICCTYTAILCEISNKSRETKEVNMRRKTGGPLFLRRSDMTNIERARIRTLRMTAAIVAAFVLCWTPYVVMTLWYMFDRESAMRVDSRLQDALFIMAVSNSCMNPLVYGSYAMNFRRVCCSGCGCFPSSLKSTTRDYKPTNEGAPTAVALISLRHVTKCMLSLGKVGSGVTRSTVTLRAVSPRSPPQQASIEISPLALRLNRPLSSGQISMASDQMAGPSFHSDPTGGTVTVPMLTYETIPSSTTSPACHQTSLITRPKYLYGSHSVELPRHL